MEQVRISSGNHELAGLYHMGTKDAAVLLVHGFALDKHEMGVFDYVAQRLSFSGFHVLRYDLPGMGESTGVLAETTFDEMIQSVHDAFAYLRKETANVSILAASFGNACSLSDLPQDCKSFVSFNPTVFGKESWESLFTLAAEKGWQGDFIAGKPVRLKSGQIVGPQLIKALKDLQLTDYVQDVTIPLLLVHGTKDQYIPVDHSQRLLEFIPGTKKLVVIEGARHGFRLERYMEQATNEAVKWFKEYGM